MLSPPRRVLAAGVFDYFHKGHQFFLQEAKTFGDELIVIIARDINVLRIKGFSPSFSECHRLKVVQKSALADEVLLGDEKNLLCSVEKISPDILILGYDQHLPSHFSEHFPDILIKRVVAKNPEQWKSSVYRSQS